MIFRIWHGHAASAAQADGYAGHLAARVFPQLADIDGHLRAYLLRRDVDDGIEIVVVTVWESCEAIRRFAGATPEKAVVEAEVASLLDRTDRHVTHYEAALANPM